MTESSSPIDMSWQVDDMERSASDLRHARGAFTCGRYDEALQLLVELRRSVDRTVAFRACLLTARVEHARPDDGHGVRSLSEVLRKRGYTCRKLAPTLVLELARTWSDIGCARLAKKAYHVLLDRLEDGEAQWDARDARAVALAHYRLGHLYMDEDNVQDAFLHWKKAYDAKKIDDVFPYAAYALASRIGGRCLPPERIDLAYREAACSKQVALAARARLEWVDFLAARGQFKSARGHLERLRAYQSAPYVKQAARRLALLDDEEQAAPMLRAFHDAVELRRTSIKLIAEPLASRRKDEDGKIRRVIIVGAGTGGRYLLHSLETLQGRPLICGFVDDDITKIPPKRLPMLGDIDRLQAIVEREGADEVLMAIPIASGNKRLDVVRACRAAGVPLRNLPSMHELSMGWDMEHPTLVNQLRAVRVEETIGRNEVRIDEDVIEWAQGLRVLVVGAGGLGAEICRRLALGAVDSLGVIDTDEGALERLTVELSDRCGLSHVVPILGDWLDSALLQREMAIRGPLVVIHANGMVSCGLASSNPFPGAYRDVLGARTVADAAGVTGVPHVLYVSDTRAADRATVFGSIKSLSEQAFLSMGDRYPATTYAALRTTPPMSTTGSILSRIAAQIECGGPVKIPGPSATAKLLSVARTAELTLHLARLMGERDLQGLFAVGAGEVEDVEKVAKEMVWLSGRVPNMDVEIVVDEQMSGETPIALRGEPVLGQSDILRLYRRPCSSSTAGALIERLKRLPDDVDQTRTLAVATIEFALAIPNFEDLSSIARA